MVTAAQQFTETIRQSTFVAVFLEEVKDAKYAVAVKQEAPKSFTENRKARYEYETLEKYQGGLELNGSEVKSIREGGAKIEGAYLTIIRGELWLLGAHIKPYSKAGKANPFDAVRNRKVLLHKKELLNLAEKTAQKGLTIVPFSLYPAGHRIKLSFGLCRGRKAHDKRDLLKTRDIDRQVRRVMRGEDVE